MEQKIRSIIRLMIVAVTNGVLDVEEATELATVLIMSGMREPLGVYSASKN